MATDNLHLPVQGWMQLEGPVALQVQNRLLTSKRVKCVYYFEAFIIKQIVWTFMPLINLYISDLQWTPTLDTLHFRLWMCSRHAKVGVGGEKKH